MLNWTYKGWEKKANFDQFQYIFFGHKLEVWNSVCFFAAVVVSVQQWCAIS